MRAPNTAPVNRRSLFQRLTRSVPLLVTVIVHAVLLAIAGIFFVSETFTEKRKTFEAAQSADKSEFTRQVEHRLSVARRAGGSSAVSPVSTQRIFSTAENALSLPDMPELAQVGASSLGGMGGFGNGVGLHGSGAGLSTSLGSSASLGRGFMSMSFLGITAQNARRVAFVVDISPELLDIRKGGFEAFAIIREEIMKLISQLPPASEFGVVVYDEGTVIRFRNEMLPASVANKTEFFEWMKPINAQPSRIGAQSVPVRNNWRARPLPDAGLDPDYLPPYWMRSLRAALELGPDAVYVINGGAGRGVRQASASEIASRKRNSEEHLADLRAQGLDPVALNRSRNASLAQARRELNAINERRREQGKPPYIVTSTRRIFDADFQAELRRAGFSIKLDYTGWTDRQGRPVWSEGNSVATLTVVGYDEAHGYIARIQRALLSKRADLNVFLFTGPNEEPENAIKNLSQVAKRNGGRFQLLNTRRLRELTGEKP
ncbi:MAG: hypothetical protein ABW223_04160 [Rariglobus sp.]